MRKNFVHNLYIPALALLLFWCGGIFPVHAQVQEASHSLVSKYLNQTLQPLPSDKEAFLVITAGGASTDLLVVANPTVPPQSLVQALQAAVAGSPLQSQPMEWSAPTSTIPWSAAHTSRRRGQIGAWQATNTIPIGAFCDGLRHSGFLVHPAMHIPDVAFCAPLPAAFDDRGGLSWYDLTTMRPRDFLQVRDTAAPSDVLMLALPLIGLPLIGFISQKIASRWAAGRERNTKNRSRFNAISSVPVMLGLVGWMIFLMLSGGNLPQWQAISDVWFGQVGNSTSASTIWLLLGLMAAGLPLLNGQRASMRLFGPEGTVPVTAMSSQERSVRERETLWASAVPLIFCGVIIAFIAGGRQLFPAWLPPQTLRLFPLLLLLPLGVYFQKKRKAFTTLLPAEALTDTLRHMAAAPGQIPPQVVVEQSGRAATYAFIENASGKRIVVSQKLCELAAPDQMTFLIVSQAILGRTRDWSKILVFVILAAFAGLSLGEKPLASLGHAIFFVVTISLMLSLLTGMFVGIAVTTRQNDRRLLDADQTALRLTNDPQAALEALEILRQNAVPPSNSNARQSRVSLQTAKRIAAISKIV